MKSALKASRGSNWKSNTTGGNQTRAQGQTNRGQGQIGRSRGNRGKGRNTYCDGRGNSWFPSKGRGRGLGRMSRQERGAHNASYGLPSYYVYEVCAHLVPV